jgi:hypothetical protein
MTANAVSGSDSVDAFVASFAAGLRDRAELLRLYGASEASTALDAAAEELESEFENWWSVEVSVVDAAAIAGLTPDHIRRLVRDGTLPHQRVSGSRSEVRIRRCDLPVRHKKGVSNLSIDDLAAQILNDRK